MWEVEYTDEFARWWDELDAPAREAVAHNVSILKIAGPALGRPHVDTIKGSRHSNMKELRATQASRALRVFFAFDPRRSAILLIGGDKSGDSQFYDRMIPLADKL